MKTEVEMQLQQNSWRFWPTASQNAVSCLDAIINQRQTLCSDTRGSGNDTVTHSVTRTQVLVNAELPEIKKVCVT